MHYNYQVTAGLHFIYWTYLRVNCNNYDFFPNFGGSIFLEVQVELQNPNRCIKCQRIKLILILFYIFSTSKLIRHENCSLPLKLEMKNKSSASWTKLFDTLAMWSKIFSESS